MKKLLLVITLCLGLVGSGFAVSSLDDHFTSVCVAEKSTGFQWKNNDWKVVNFIPDSKYIAKKVNPSEVKDYQCDKTKNRTLDYYTLESNNQRRLMTHGCYSIKQFDYPDLGLKIDCMEDWSAYAGKDGENNSKPKKLESVMCWDKRFFFSPNGLFHSAMLHGDVDKYSDYKDSLALIAGKCSTL